jgi:hypothetical protein
MSKIWRAEVVMPYTTNLPKDVSMNVLHWLVDDGADSADLADLSGHIATFYNGPFEPDDVGPSFYISDVVTRAEEGCRIEWYEVDPATPDLPSEVDPDTGIPQSDDTSTWLDTYLWTLGATTTDTMLPLEVAICISTKATPALPVPIRRRRGRVYIGPLTTDVVKAGSPYLPRVDPNVMQTLANAADYLAGTPTAGQWAIYSGRAAQAYVVSEGFVDNEFDTQRRRQLRATERVLWSGL